MKKLILLPIVFLICNFAVMGQNAEPEDLQTLNKIAQEHQNTRKYFSDELTRQRTEFFKLVDDRANYYEDTVRNILSSAVFKLALLWGGIMLFFTSFNNFLRNRIEKRRYKKLKDNIKDELRQEMMKYAPQQPQNISIPKQTEQKQVIRGDTGYSVDTETLLEQAPAPKNPFPSTRKEKKAMKKLNKINEGMAYFQDEKKKLQDALGITPIGSNETQYVYDKDVEVDY